MSIATDITRIQNAKTAIKTAIENKGVTVPESTKIDGYSALIDEIATGGGSGGITKLGKPLNYVDLDTDVYAVVVNPVTAAFAGQTKLSINGEETLMDGTYPGTTTEGNKTFGKANQSETPYYCSSTVYGKNFTKYLGDLEAGVYNIKNKTLERTSDMLHGAGVKFPDSEYAGVRLSDSLWSDPIEYIRYKTQLNLTNLYSATANITTNSSKMHTHNIKNYASSINYIFDPSCGGKVSNLNGTTSSYDSYGAIIGGDVLIADSTNYYGVAHYCKVSFTLTEPTEVSVKIRVESNTSTSTSTDQCINIGAIDKTQTSFTYYNKWTSNVAKSLTMPIKSECPYEEIYSFGTVDAGDHFYYIQFYNYYSAYNTYATVEPLYEKQYNGYYFPSDITVSSNGDSIDDYKWDPYNGKLNINYDGNPNHLIYDITIEGSTLENIVPLPDIICNYNNNILSASISDTSLTGLTYELKNKYGNLTSSDGNIDISSLPYMTDITAILKIYKDGYRSSGDRKLYLWKNDTLNFANERISLNIPYKANSFSYLLPIRINNGRILYLFPTNTIEGCIYDPITKETYPIKLTNTPGLSSNRYNYYFDDTTDYLYYITTQNIKRYKVNKDNIEFKASWNIAAEPSNKFMFEGDKFYYIAGTPNLNGGTLPEEGGTATFELLSDKISGKYNYRRPNGNTLSGNGNFNGYSSFPFMYSKDNELYIAIDSIDAMYDYTLFIIYKIDKTTYEVLDKYYKVINGYHNISNMYPRIYNGNNIIFVSRKNPNSNYFNNNYPFDLYVMRPDDFFKRSTGELDTDIIELEDLHSLKNIKIGNNSNYIGGSNLCIADLDNNTYYMTGVTDTTSGYPHEEVCYR